MRIYTKKIKNTQKIKKKITQIFVAKKMHTNAKKNAQKSKKQVFWYNLGVRERLSTYRPSVYAASVHAARLHVFSNPGENGERAKKN